VELGLGSFGKSLFEILRAPHSHAGPAAILIDELDAGFD